MSPKSDPDEINELDIGWKEPLDNIFSNHIPIVIGYGGNDGSLMSYFEKMNKPSNFFWCGYKGSSISLRTEKLIETMDGSYVETNGFDEIMHELLWVFDEIKPIQEELKEITKSRIEAASEQLSEIDEKNKLSKTKNNESDKELSAFEYSNLAEKEPDFNKRKEIYLEDLDKFPTTIWLWSQFTYFLHVVKKDVVNLDDYYLKALSVDHENAINNGNNASFLQDIKKDYDNAEKYYLKALSIDPEHANTNGNYACFLLINNRKDEATKYLEIAFNLNKGEKNDLLIELWLL